MENNNLVETPWDKKVLDMDTYELLNKCNSSMQYISSIKGHFTIKVDPLEDKKILFDNNFYYVDTLIEPYCTKKTFRVYKNNDTSINHRVELCELLNLFSPNLFLHGRFHKDFNINNELADKRYTNWIIQLYEENKVFGLMYNNKLAGFFAYEKNKIVLHAIGDDFRGKGIAKYLWSKACEYLFSLNYSELYSSVSASNMAIINLYISLGFKFRNPQEVYHKINR